MARFCPSRGFILDLGGGLGFAVPFYFVQDCLKASTGVTHSVMITIMTRNLRLNASKLNAFKANLVICQ